MRHFLTVLTLMLILVINGSAEVVKTISFDDIDSIYYAFIQNPEYEINLNVKGNHQWNVSNPFVEERKKRLIVKPAREGSFAEYFSQAQWVLAEHGPEKETETYLGRLGDALVIYGYVVDFEKNPSLIKGSNPDTLMLFPLTPGKRWTSAFVYPCDDELLTNTSTREVLDTGRIVTELGTFSCAVLKTHSVDAHCNGDTVSSCRYDWVVPGMWIVASIISRDNEPHDILTRPSSVSRIIEYGERAKPQEKINFHLRATSYDDGLMIAYTLAEPAEIVLMCFDTNGRKIWTKEFDKEAGEHEFYLEGLYRSIYFVRIETSEASQTVPSELAE